MLKSALILASQIVFCWVPVATAAPLDSPDTVYIDGLPCNSACQSYMAWSRKVSGQAPSASITEQQPSAAIARKGKKNAAKKPASAGAAMQPKARSADKVVARDAPQSASSTGQVHSGVRSVKGSPEEVAPVQTPAPDPRPAPEAMKLPPQIVEPVPVVPDPGASAPAAQPSLEGNNTTTSSLAAKSSDGASRAAPEPAKIDHLVAILLVREDIKSVSELADKVVAIDASQANSVSDIKNAIAKAGANDVRISEEDKLALGRVMDGEVPASVLSVVSPEEAAMWASVPGFNILRLPIAPHSSKAGP
jgi:hypothetical protein